MAIALGGTVIEKIALGVTEVLKIYHGATLIYDQTGAPPIADAILLENGTDALLLESGEPVELDASIPAQSDAATLDGSEWLVIVQGGTTKKVRAARVAEFIND